MKSFSFQKLFVVSVFLFSLTLSLFALPLKASAQVSDLANPNEAEAQAGIIGGVTAVKSMYDLWCSTKEFQETGKFECETHRQPYISSLISDLAFDTIALFAWGQTTGDVFTENGEPPFTYGEIFAASSEERQAYNEVLAHGRIPNSFTSMATSTALAFQAQPPIPTDMALFINDSFQDTMFGTPAFAANPVETSYRIIILEGWKVTRNLALSVLGLVLAIVGLMIIFRSKLAPQVTVSIYNVLPTLPIAIALIVLSYPLISLALSSIQPLTQVANQIGYQVVKSALPVEAQAVLTTNNSFSVTLGAALRSVWDVYLVLEKTNSVTAMFFMMGFLLAITIGTISFFWSVAKIFMSFITTTLLAPLAMVIAVLPGKQGLIMNLLKRLFVDMISLPAMIVGGYVGLAIIAYTPTPDLNAWWNISGVINNAAAGIILFIPLIIKGFIGIGFLFGLGKIRKNFESGLGVTGLFGGGGDAKGPPRR